MSDTQREIFNLEQAAEYMGTCIATLQRILDEDGVPYRRNGKRYFIAKRALDDWVLKIQEKE